jgi:hypothetical protein
LRARPEPTQLEHISNASFLGKLLVLPANVRIDWKVIASYKHSPKGGTTRVVCSSTQIKLENLARDTRSSLFGVFDEEKKFDNIDNVINLFSFVTDDKA